ncbi:tyrosine-type recombinase/integrase [Butyrivibrio sp. WCD3002]|uniref:tyrosine-type recombinase/integrase n=1 Tax=Butyrivibrio sp. WCD3002 TaxID=1280676 RepID=UPI00041D16C8|nr:tyrosine-type recombinase/integrase [Butyrivibrio sp. WCD3002]
MKHKTGYEYGIELMFCLCIRIGELKALRWNDVDFRKKTINISREVVLRKDSNGINRSVELNHTKGGEHGSRVLPLSDRALIILKCLREQPKVYEHIVYTAEGNPLNTGHFNDHLKAITARAGVPYLSSHKIRFWSVTELARATGGDLETVMYAAGHADKNTTLHYIRAVQADAQLDAIRSCFA